MEPDSMTKTKLFCLNQELHALHVRNRHYWQEQAPSTTDRSLYQIRLDRLEEIRSELVRLCALPAAGEVIDSIEDRAEN